MNPRRRIPVGRTIAAGIIGVLATVLLAWIGATVGPRHPADHTKNDLAWPIEVPPGWPSRADYRVHSASWLLDEVTWFRQEAPRMELHYVCVHAYGWPFKALTCSMFLRTDATGGTYWDNGIRLPRSWVGTGRIGVLPILPMPAFGLDAALLGVAAFVLLSLPRVTRRLWLRRRGRCVECGYDLSGLPAGCPECGAGR